MIKKIHNVLVVCSDNSARSILGEVLFDRLGNGRVRAFSAGSNPAGKVDPVALEILQNRGIRVVDLRSKSWDEFSGADAPEIDFIFTVCATAASEPRPAWTGDPVTVHWEIADPAHIEPIEVRRKAFEAVYRQLEFCVYAFLDLPLETMSKSEITQAARRIYEGDC